MKAIRSASATSRTGTGVGSIACFIGGIFNNFQPVGGSVVKVTLDLATDELGWDVGPSQSGSAPVQRSVPLRHSAPGSPTRPAMLNGKQNWTHARRRLMKERKH